MKNKNFLRYLLLGNWARPKPKRKRGLKRRFNFAAQPRAIQHLISTGHFNDPADAQAFLDLHHATHAHQVEPLLPPLWRRPSFAHRLKTWLLYLLGEHEFDETYHERSRLQKARRRRNRHQVRLRRAVVHRPRDRLPRAARSDAH